jgi:integrase
LFNWLKKRDMILHNPVERVVRRRIHRAAIRYLSKDEIAALLCATRGTAVESVVALAIYTGARRGELLSLTWDDVNWQTGCIEVYATKTAKRRAVPFHRALRPLLEDWREGRGGCAWLCPSPKASRWDGKNCLDAIAAIEAAHGLPRWGFLDFRHTFASQLAMAGMSLFMIAKLLGNSPDVCMAHYAHIATETLHQFVDF